MPSIAFITYDQRPDSTPGDRLAIAQLQARGHTIQPAIWNDPTINWARFDLIVFRSCWDYFRHPVEFDALLDQLELLNLPSLNPMPIIKWNRGKHYLQDLAARGMNVVPTAWLPQGETAVLADILLERGWAQAVVKPVISGTAFHTWRTSHAQAAEHQPQLNALLAQRDMMIQPFIPEIVSLGEYSLIYFNKQFSHAVLKQAVSGDFRVQSDFGGTATPVTPDGSLVAAGEAILAAVDSPIAYARVDGTVVNGRFMLLELELVEPELHLHTNPNAPARFAEAIITLGDLT